MRASTKRILAFLVSIIGFFYIVGITFNSIVPTLSRISSLREEISEKKIARDRVNELVSKVRDLISRKDEFSQKAALIDSSLPPSPKIPELAAALYAIASKNNSDISQIKFDVFTLQTQSTSQSDRPPVSTVTTRLTMIGKYQDVKSAIKDIESEIRLMDLAILNIQSASGEEAPKGEIPVVADLEINSYWQQ
jgi:hypothetical protein